MSIINALVLKGDVVSVPIALYKPNKTIQRLPENAVFMSCGVVLPACNDAFSVESVLEGNLPPQHVQGHITNGWIIRPDGNLYAFAFERDVSNDRMADEVQFRRIPHGPGAFLVRSDDLAVEYDYMTLDQLYPDATVMQLLKHQAKSAKLMKAKKMYYTATISELHAKWKQLYPDAE